MLSVALAAVDQVVDHMVVDQVEAVDHLVVDHMVVDQVVVVDHLVVDHMVAEDHINV